MATYTQLCERRAQIWSLKNLVNKDNMVQKVEDIVHELSNDLEDKIFDYKRYVNKVEESRRPEYTEFCHDMSEISTSFCNRLYDFDVQIQKVREICAKIGILFRRVQTHMDNLNIPNKKKNIPLNRLGRKKECEEILHLEEQCFDLVREYDRIRSWLISGCEPFVQSIERTSAFFAQIFYTRYWSNRFPVFHY